MQVASVDLNNQPTNQPTNRTLPPMQVVSVDLDNGRDCMDKFVSNRWVGAIVFAAIVADKLLLLPL